jgi:hypothetical protein
MGQQPVGPSEISGITSAYDIRHLLGNARSLRFYTTHATLELSREALTPYSSFWQGVI